MRNHPGEDDEIDPDDLGQKMHQRGLMLFEQGEALYNNDVMYVIEKGSVEVYRDDVHVNTLGPGNLLGELALMYDMPRISSWYSLKLC